MEIRRIAARAVTAVLLSASALLTGCASFYVDGHLPEVPSAQYRKPAEPRPVQLLWEFKTRGVSNARVTEHLLFRVREQVTTSGLFQRLVDTPTPQSGLLVLTVNNIPLNGDDPATKGFIAGLTFGLIGTTLGDGYECALQYTPPGATTAVKRQAKHVIYTSLGTGAKPPNVITVPNVEEAGATMLRQCVSRLLADLSQDPSFN